MSLPAILNLTSDNIPYRGKILTTDKEKNERFKNEIFNTSDFKIGLSYKGNEAGPLTRNIPLEALIPLTKIKGAKLYSLQYNEPDSCFWGMEIVNLSSYIKDFDDTASLIENLDLLISIDNSVMNLSGALSKKTYCIFNNLAEYRWFNLDGDDVKWYSSVKPYQARTRNGFDEVIKKIVSDIKF